MDAAHEVHSQFGPGLLESAYEAMLVHELRTRGLHIANQEPVLVLYDGVRLDVGFRADLIVEEKVIVELKALEQVAPVHKRQLLTYLKVTGCKLGLPVNFGANLIRDASRGSLMASLTSPALALGFRVLSLCGFVTRRLCAARGTRILNWFA